MSIDFELARMHVRNDVMIACTMTHLECAAAARYRHKKMNNQDGRLDDSSAKILQERAQSHAKFAGIQARVRK